MSGAGGNLFEGSGDQRVAGVPADTLGLLRLSLIPGLGPVLIGRLVEACGSAAGALVAPERHLRAVRGIGPERARAVIDHREASKDLAQRELDRAAALDVRIIGRAEPGYPPLLAHLADAPSILYVRGELDGHALDRYALAVVGSRRCTQYGIEQAERFAGAVAAAGLTIVSGGARGIDTAAHRAALRSGGRTVAVLGCGLAHVYPEENGPLFEQISDGRGAIVSELPLDTQPAPENFPARNRLISGLSLGVLVIEAGKGSGALITARVAVEEHQREVFAVPGRLDSAASQGSNALLKAGAAALVTDPADVIEQLQAPARHLHAGTHAARYGGPDQPPAEAALAPALGLTPRQASIASALTHEMTVDELCIASGVGPAELRADLTMLEVMKKVVRVGSRVAPARSGNHPG